MKIRELLGKLKMVREIKEKSGNFANFWKIKILEFKEV